TNGSRPADATAISRRRTCVRESSGYRRGGLRPFEQLSPMGLTEGIRSQPWQQGAATGREAEPGRGRERLQEVEPSPPPGLGGKRRPVPPKTALSLGVTIGPLRDTGSDSRGGSSPSP